MAIHETPARSLKQQQNNHLRADRRRATERKGVSGRFTYYILLAKSSAYIVR